MKVQQLLLYEIRMVLNLEGRRRDPRVSQHVIDQLRLEVGNTDRPRQLLVHERLHRRPRHVHGRVATHYLGLAVVMPAWGIPHRRVDVLECAREVDEVQVEVVEAPVRQRPPDCRLDLVPILENGP
ncbi:hypothetical protein RRF57_006275 [Xylaria bambusicola]|uniref:Uncharacterized protein n=1 Tax=Xylaria bambusicola TaxID=326684 RepID=A0AAN7YYM0_9PEZI